MRFGRWCFPDANQLLVIDIGDQRLSCVVCEGKDIVLSQAMPFSFPSEISGHLEKLSAFLMQKGGIDDKIPWILTGQVGFAEQIAAVFKGRQLAQNDAAYAVCLGLGLEAIQQDSYYVQFCQKQFHPCARNRKKKEKRPEPTFLLA